MKIVLIDAEKKNLDISAIANEINKEAGYDSKDWCVSIGGNSYQRQAQELQEILGCKIGEYSTLLGIDSRLTFEYIEANRLVARYPCVIFFCSTECQKMLPVIYSKIVGSPMNELNYLNTYDSSKHELIIMEIKPIDIKIIDNCDEPK